MKHLELINGKWINTEEKAMAEQKIAQSMNCILDERWASIIIWILKMTIGELQIRLRWDIIDFHRQSFKKKRHCRVTVDIIPLRFCIQRIFMCTLKIHVYLYVFMMMKQRHFMSSSYCCRPSLQLLDVPNLLRKSNKMMSSSSLVFLFPPFRIFASHSLWMANDVILFLNNFSSRLAQIRTFRI